MKASSDTKQSEARMYLKAVNTVQYVTVSYSLRLNILHLLCHLVKDVLVAYIEQSSTNPFALEGDGVLAQREGTTSII